jgi:hypothetical protein
VVLPWNRFAAQSNSLFLFRVVLGLMALGLMGGLFALGISDFDQLIQRAELSARSSIRFAAVLFSAAGVGLVFLVVRKLTIDFVVPIMFLRGVTCRAGWAELLDLLGQRAGNFLLYLLFSLVLSLAIGILVLAVVLLTCCVAGCLLALPYLGTVVLLPVLVFRRAYSAWYLAQYGGELNVFRRDALPAIERI